MLPWRQCKGSPSPLFAFSRSSAPYAAQIACSCLTKVLGGRDFAIFRIEFPLDYLPPRGPIMKFEYLLLDARLFERASADLERELNSLGSENWDLVATCGVHGQTFVFKRPIAPAAPTTTRRKQATTS
jgi:hypothetical protein